MSPDVKIYQMLAVQVGLDVMIEADQQELRQKSMALGSLFLQLVDQVCGLCEGVNTITIEPWG